MTTISIILIHKRYERINEGKKVGNATNNSTLIIDTEIKGQKHAAAMLHFMQVPTHNNNNKVFFPFAYRPSTICNFLLTKDFQKPIGCATDLKIIDT